MVKNNLYMKLFSELFPTSHTLAYIFKLLRGVIWEDPSLLKRLNNIHSFFHIIMLLLISWQFFFLKSFSPSNISQFAHLLINSEIFIMIPITCQTQYWGKKCSDSLHFRTLQYSLIRKSKPAVKQLSNFNLH